MLKTGDMVRIYAGKGYDSNPKIHGYHKLININTSEIIGMILSHGEWCSVITPEFPGGLWVESSQLERLKYRIDALE